jgi:hypothetical protein
MRGCLRIVVPSCPLSPPPCPWPFGFPAARVGSRAWALLCGCARFVLPSGRPALAPLWPWAAGVGSPFLCCFGLVLFLSFFCAFWLARPRFTPALGLPSLARAPRPSLPLYSIDQGLVLSGVSAAS